MKSLWLSFKTASNNDYTIKISDAKVDATAIDIKKAMQDIIDCDVIMTSTGKLKSIEKAELFELVETVFEID